MSDRVASESDWRPSASLQSLRERAKVLKRIRRYFDQQLVMEVDTPVLSSAATVDLHIESFSSPFIPVGGDERRSSYLCTSPEFPMKRLLAAGSGDIYYLGKVFRNGEVGGRHNPEFTMLEYYRLGFDLQQLMDDMSRLLSSVCEFGENGRVSYGELFEGRLGVNPHQASDEELKELVDRHIDSSIPDLERNDLLDLLFSSFIEPHLGVSDKNTLQGVYVYDFPGSMSALARTRLDERGHLVADRFELFIDGTEVANGYYELTDAKEQRFRFEQETDKRRCLGKTDYPYDERLVMALEHGLPECSGVAIGIDRLMMLIQGTQDIAHVLAFDFKRA